MTVFTRLALYDKSEQRFDEIFGFFKDFFNQIDYKITHIKFLAKFWRYLYEDAYENLENSKISFKKEIALKRKHATFLVDYFRQGVIDYPNEEVDEIVYGMSCLYIFRQRNLTVEDANIFWDLSRYKNLNSFMESINKILEYSLVCPDTLNIIWATLSKMVIKEIEDSTLELISISLCDIMKWTFDVEEISESDQENVRDFIISLLKQKSNKFKASMYLFDALSHYTRWKYFNSDQIRKFSEDIVFLCLERAKYPYFFDMQSLIPQKREVPKKYQSLMNKAKKQEDSDDDMPIDTEMDNEQSAFVHMRESIKSLILELWLKTDCLDNILIQILHEGNQALSNTENLSIDQLGFKVEAILMVLYHFIENIRPNTKIKNYDETSTLIKDFFLSDIMKDIFAGENTQWLISKMYLDCITQLKEFVKDEEDKQKTCELGLEILFKPNIMMSDEPGLISYYLNTFSKFMNRNMRLIDEQMSNQIEECLQSKIIPTLTAGDEKYSWRTPILFDIYGMITYNNNRALEARVNSTMKALDFIKNMFEHADNLHHFILCNKCIMNFMCRVPRGVETDISSLFYFIQAEFVKKVAPTYTIEMVNSDEIWNLSSYIEDSEGRKCMIELRRLIFQVYIELANNFDSVTTSNLFKLSFPVLISCLNNEVDSFTGKEVKIFDVSRLLKAFEVSFSRYIPDILNCFRLVAYRLLRVVQNQYRICIDQNYDERSDAHLQIRNLITMFLKVVEKVSFYDCHILFVKEDNVDFLSDLLIFISDLIHSPIDIKATENALTLMLWLVKELTNYEDDVEKARKIELIGQYTNKSIVGVGKFQ